MTPLLPTTQLCHFNKLEPHMNIGFVVLLTVSKQWGLHPHSFSPNFNAL